MRWERSPCHEELTTWWILILYDLNRPISFLFIFWPLFCAKTQKNMKTVRHGSRDRERYTATQDVPLLSLCNCLPNAHIIMKKELKGKGYKLLPLHQAASFHLMMMQYDQLTVCSSSLSEPTYTQLLKQDSQKETSKFSDGTFYLELHLL